MLFYYGEETVDGVRGYTAFSRQRTNTVESAVYNAVSVNYEKFFHSVYHLDIISFILIISYFSDIENNFLRNLLPCCNRCDNRI